MNSSFHALWVCLFLVLPIRAGEDWEETPGYGISDYFTLSPGSVHAGIRPLGKPVRTLPRFTARVQGGTLELVFAEQLSGGLRILLRDLQGRKRADTSVRAQDQGSVRCGLPEIPNGVYVLEVSLDRGETRFQILPLVSISLPRR